MIPLAIEFAGRQFADGAQVGQLLASLALNLFVLVLIVAVLYFPDRRDREHAFMMVMLNVIVFLIGHFMGRLNLGIEFGFGLFALFGIIRYRTEAVPVREMSYLFAVIALGLLNAVGADQLSWVDLFIANGALLITLTFLSRFLWRQTPQVRLITYERIENIRPDRQAELYWDLWERTGLDVVDVEVISINFMNDTAKLRVYHKASQDDQHSVRSPLPGQVIAGD